MRGFHHAHDPTYDTYRRILEAHTDELDDPASVVRYRDRFVTVFKVECVVATYAETGEVVCGWVYLCATRGTTTASATSSWAMRSGPDRRSRGRSCPLASGSASSQSVPTGTWRPRRPAGVLPAPGCRSAIRQHFGCANTLLHAQQEHGDDQGPHAALLRCHLPVRGDWEPHGCDRHPPRYCVARSRATLQRPTASRWRQGCPTGRRRRLSGRAPWRRRSGARWSPCSSACSCSRRRSSTPI